MTSTFTLLSRVVVNGATGKILARLLLGALLVVALLACKQAGDGAPGCSRGGKPQLTEVGRALVATWEFRAVARRSYAKALQTFVDDATRRSLVALEADVWPATDASVGWAQLLESSVVCAGEASGDRVPIAFYHPWSDVFLVLVWQLDGADPRIVDAEVLIGDFVRQGDAAGWRAVRSWTERRVYAPYAVGLATAESVAAFEAAFAARRGALDLRVRLPKLKDPAFTEALHVAAGKQLIDTSAELAPLLTAEDGVLRGKLATLMRGVGRGDSAAVVAEAKETPVAAAPAIASMRLDDWRRMQPVALVAHGEASLLMLSDTGGPDHFLTLKLVRYGAEVRLARVDLMSFGEISERADSLRKETER